MQLCDHNQASRRSGTPQQHQPPPPSTIIKSEFETSLCLVPPSSPHPPTSLCASSTIDPLATVARESLSPPSSSVLEPAAQPPARRGTAPTAPQQHAESPSRGSVPEPAPRLVPATRPRTELELHSAGATDSIHSSDDAELARAAKRQRIERSPPIPLFQLLPDQPSHPTATTSRATGTMRLTDSDQDSNLSVSPDCTAHAGPSMLGLGHPGSSSSSSTAAVVAAAAASNGHTNGAGNGFVGAASTNGFASSPPVTNGSFGAAGNGVVKHGKAIARVSLPGTTLYDDDSMVDREEYIRLVIQSLRDVGYIESAATLEAESGYSMESSDVSSFRHFVLEGSWTKAEEALSHLGVSEEGIWEAKFLISQQKYLELLEARKTTAALYLLRNELAPLSVDPDLLHTLSSFIMCSEPDDLRARAQWDGAAGTSRRRLLNSLQRYIPSSVMIPPRRFTTLIHQAQMYQRQRCLYHNSPSNASSYSLYTDHQCNKSAFPRITTTILEVHTDEVWNMEWSHDGYYLATASKDKTAIIWKLGMESTQDWTLHHILRDHPYPVGCLAWSKDDSILLTSSDNFIKLWNTKSGLCMQTLEEHSDTVTALAWLPDGTGFLSGGLDRKIIHWDVDGKLREHWGAIPIRVTDFAITPDFTRLVTVGMYHISNSGMNDAAAAASHRVSSYSDVAVPGHAGTGVAVNGSRTSDNRMIIYDLATKQIESSIRLEGELTSIKVSQNSQYALINHAPNEIHLWDLKAARLARKYTGQTQGRHVIRSCFGGVDGNFVVSGSEDGNVYVWHRDTGVVLEVLSGHGEGSVNSVAWNPRNERMFASCSDDHTIRIWESPPPEMLLEDSSVELPATAEIGSGKGKMKQLWNGDGLTVSPGLDSSRL